MARRLTSKSLRRPFFTRLNLEQFETRIVPASTVVKSTADSGPDTLRSAIAFANASGATTITFDFPPGGPLLFTPATPLPALMNKTTFLTIPATEKRVEISGVAAGPGTTGLTFMAGGYIEDVSITGWSGFGLSLSGGSVTVIDSYIGTNHGGTVDKGNLGGGIEIKSGGNTIFSNVVSGNEGVGILLKGAGAGGNSISATLIGVAGDGVTAMANKGDGIFCDDAPGNLLGGTFFGNVVSGNGGNGIYIKGAGAMGNKIVASNIGVSLDGSPVPNSLAGVFIESAPDTSIGGAAAEDHNVISSNLLNGVAIIGPTAKGNLLRGNFIGVGIDGMADRGNKFTGVLIAFGASDNFIGKPLADHSNIIAFNGADQGLKGHGVQIASGTGNTISRNAIFKNSGRGIDLNGDWVTINDAKGDPDAGANNSQDYPVVITRPDIGISDGGMHTWKLNSAGSSTFTVEFFENASLDPAEYGEGKTYITSKTVVTDAAGDATFTFDHTGYTFVTTTATDSKGNTSEFSLIDTDADSLADVWEIADGLDINEDGALTANEYVLIGSNRLQKDLFVEVDAMTGFGPAAAIFDAGTPATAGGVIKAFSLATNTNIHNPDLADGINLHVVYDEKTISPEAFTVVDKAFVRFQEIKNGTGTGLDGRFGTVLQRGDVNWVQIRQALSLTHRYSMFAQQYSYTSKDSMGNVNKDNKGNPIIIDSSSGLGELHGNDFMVTFGAAGWSNAPFVLTDIDRAGTWMHEFGHTLGLNHGGAITDTVNNKPNYHSVMNYLWQFPNARNRFAAVTGDYSGSWTLDYSGEKLDDLNEASLDEIAGIKGGSPAFSVPFGGGGKIALAASGGAKVDWDFSGSEVGTVQADINFSNGNTDVLKGHNDWANLQYHFLERASFASGYAEEPDGDEGPPSTAYPRVASVQINGGDAQRSRVTSVTVNFDRHINISFSLANAFVVTRQSDSKMPTLVTNVDDSGTTTVVTLTFTGTNAVDYGSLADGRYTLTVLDSEVANGFGLLDGDGDGVPGGNYVLACETNTMLPPTNIFRIFGDATGDGTVAASDFIIFRQFFNGVNDMFDFNADGSVSSSDFVQFRLRFNGSI